MSELDELKESFDEIKALLKLAVDRFSVTQRWLSFKQAMLYANMSRNKLKKHIDEGDIYGTQKGGKIFVDRDSIDAFFLDDDVRSKLRIDEIMKAG